MRSEHAKLQFALKDINRHVSDAVEVIGDLTIAAFAANKEKTAAVAWHGVVIGEAAKRALQSGHHIEDRELVTELERVRSARNEFAHEYDVLEADNLYVTVTDVYVPLQKRVRSYLGRVAEPPKGDNPQDDTTPGGWTK